MNFKTLMFGLTLISTTISVAQTNTVVQSGARSNDKSQIETLVTFGKGPRTDGGGNFVWDADNNQFKLLDIHIFESVIEIDPVKFLEKSALFQKMKNQAEVNFYSFYRHLGNGAGKRWLFVKDMNWSELTKHMDCVNSSLVTTSIYVGACQPRDYDFVLIDFNRFNNADGNSQIGLLVHELAVSQALWMKLYDDPKSKAMTELNIQLFVGAAVSLKADISTYRNLFSALFGKRDTLFLSNYLYDKRELQSIFDEFVEGREKYCGEAGKLDRNSGIDFYIELRRISGPYALRLERTAVAHQTLKYFFFPLEGKIADLSALEFYYAASEVSSFMRNIPDYAKKLVDRNLALLCD